MLWILLLSLGLLQEFPTPLASRHPPDHGGSLLDEADSSSLQIVQEEPPESEPLAVLAAPVMTQAELGAAAALRQQAAREERSPRRCVRLQESCLGHRLPCCDPCASCYCRFFNASCFCKRLGGGGGFPCGGGGGGGRH